jgi:hypothetical protein
MNPKAKKLVFVIQDLMTKDKEIVAVVSGDIHLEKEVQGKKIVSFQMLLEDNREFARVIKALVNQAIALQAKAPIDVKVKQKSTRGSN